MIPHSPIVTIAAVVALLLFLISRLLSRRDNY